MAWVVFEGIDSLGNRRMDGFSLGVIPCLIPGSQQVCLFFPFYRGAYVSKLQTSTPRGTVLKWDQT